MSWADQWQWEALGNRKRAGGSLPMIDLSCLMGPPEVRVVRLSLGTRPQDGKGPSPEQPKAPRPARQSVSPSRVRRRKKKSKKSQTTTDLDENRLPMSVTLGRALGAQVQPLMAVLMSPRVRIASHLSDSEAGSEEEPEDEVEVKSPLLSITSLELPDLAPPRKPHCQPVRRVRTSVLRNRPSHRACSVADIACSGNAISTTTKN